MNSIIEAQITLQEERVKEIERCKDPLYFYENYITINGRKPIVNEVQRRLFSETTVPNPIFYGRR